MALVHHLFTTTPPSRSGSLSSSSLAASDSFTRLHKKSIGLNQKLFNGPQVHTPIKLKDRYAVIVKSSSDVDGTGPVPEPPSERKNNYRAQKLAESILFMSKTLDFLIKDGLLPEEFRDGIMRKEIRFLLLKEISHFIKEASKVAH